MRWRTKVRGSSWPLRDRACWAPFMDSFRERGHSVSLKVSGPSSHCGDGGAPVIGARRDQYRRRTRPERPGTFSDLTRRSTKTVIEAANPESRESPGRSRRLDVPRCDGVPFSGSFSGGHFWNTVRRLHGLVQELDVSVEVPDVDAFVDRDLTEGFNYCLRVETRRSR